MLKPRGYALPGCVVIDAHNGYVLFYVTHMGSMGDVKHGYGLCTRSKASSNIGEGFHSYFSEISDSQHIVVVGPFLENE